MSSATTRPGVDTYVATIAISSGSLIALGANASPSLFVPPAGRLICGWSISTRPTDANGSIYVASNVGAAMSPTAMAAAITAGTAIRLDPGEALSTPANLPGPFSLSLAVTAVGAATTIRLVVHMVNA